MPAFRVGRRVRINPRDLNRFIEAGSTVPVDGKPALQPQEQAWERFVDAVKQLPATRFDLEPSLALAAEKIQHGQVREVGIAARAVTRSLAAQRRFLHHLN